MKTTRKQIIGLLAFVLLFIGCDIYNLDINEDPNDPNKASLELLLPSIQQRWARDYQTIHNVAGGIIGHTSNSDDLQLDQNSFDNLWINIYTDEIADLDEYLEIASEESQSGEILTKGALGVGLLLKAHIYSTMVDLFGKVPYSEAADGDDSGIVSPKLDDGSEIYSNCLTLIDEAIVHLTNSTLSIVGDLIYGGDKDSWISVGYSLKLKLLVQARLANNFAYGKGIDEEIKDVIDNHGDKLLGGNSVSDFAFRWNTNQDLGQRHPWTFTVYSGDNSFSYISHQLMYEMLINHDPRIAYYFKRQTTNVLDQEDDTQKNTTPCSQNAACIYGYMVLNEDIMNEMSEAGVTPGSTDSASTATSNAYIASFFGRDKGDPSGVPLDGALRTAPGAFPMGGQFDIGKPEKIESASGVGLGDGHTYFLSAPMVSLYKIEAYLEIYNDVAKAKEELSNFVRISMKQVETASLSFSGSNAISMDQVATETAHKHVISVDDYIANVQNRFDNANDKMDVVFKEAWYSLFGSALELYNSHRRTDYPKMKLSQSGSRGIGNIQYPTFRGLTSAGQRDYPVIWPYPLSEVNLNSNLSATDIVVSDGDKGVFWDPSLFKYQ